MIVVGLTGSIGMGKSAAAAALRRAGVPVHEADATVHRLMGPGGAALAAVAEAFPGVLKHGAIDRAALGRRVFADPAALARLEAILHPLVADSTKRFLDRIRAARGPVAVLDVPLLFETQGRTKYDLCVVVTAPRAIQLQRVMRRPGMSLARLGGIEARQLADAEKRRRADAVVPTGLSRRASRDRLLAILARLTRGARGRSHRSEARPCFNVIGSGSRQTSSGEGP
jgi:dephospho-CoA kinase